MSVSGLSVLGACSFMLPLLLFTPCGKAEEGGGEKKAKKGLEAVLKKRMSVDFVQTPLQDVVDFLANLTNTTILVDPAVVEEDEKAITLKVEDMQARLVIDWIVRLAGLAYVVKDDAIFISNKKTVTRVAKAKKPRATGALKKTLERKISFDIVQTPLSDVFAFLSNLSGLNMVVHPAVLPEKRYVTLRVKEMPLGTAIDWIACLAGVKYSFEKGNTIYFFTAKTRPKK